jgi:uncharacterized protein YdhG (YjbR/CyaY superfamily)
MGTVDDFLSGLSAEQRPAFRQIVTLASAGAPDADQGTSYGMPALIYRGRPLLGFAAAKAHVSIFPFSPAVVDGVRARLDGYSLSKGTIRFTAEAPLPDDVVTEVVRLRRDEIDGALG